MQRADRFLWLPVQLMFEMGQCAIFAASCLVARSRWPFYCTLDSGLVGGILARLGASYAQTWSSVSQSEAVRKYPYLVRVCEHCACCCDTCGVTCVM